MKTEINIDGKGFLINGKPTYEGVIFNSKKVEGLLYNTRMVQAIFDDVNPATREKLKYPDTGIWDPDRNADEFCAALPTYRDHGVLGVTVGLQGGGHYYYPEVYGKYINSAFRPDGTFKKEYFDRLKRVLQAADDVGMIVIVNYFYWKQIEKIPEEIYPVITQKVTAWLLETGYKNILVDIFNEVGVGRIPAFMPDTIHKLIDVAQNVELDGRRLLISSSACGGSAISVGKWCEMEDFSIPHGNGCQPDQLKAKLRKLKGSAEFLKNPKPIMINEDSIFTDNLDAALEEYVSWGFYCQGYGSEYQDRMNWKVHRRETEYESLSGFQTVPVNWGINTDTKRNFFNRVKEITAQKN